MYKLGARPGVVERAQLACPARWAGACAPSCELQRHGGCRKLTPSRSPCCACCSPRAAAHGPGLAAPPPPALHLLAPPCPAPHQAGLQRGHIQGQPADQVALGGVVKEGLVLVQHFLQGRLAAAGTGGEQVAAQCIRTLQLAQPTRANNAPYNAN